MPVPVVEFSDERLPNGLRLIVVEDHLAPVVAVNIWYNVGSKHEVPGKTGFAHLFEHVMFQGSAHVGKAEHMALVVVTTYFVRRIVRRFGYKTPNFTTAGIFHLHGFVTIKNEQLPWSIILKVIKPDSTEKEEPLHHNYWRREALVFESKLLDDLPDSIQAAKSYLIEEQQDGTIWLWMERVKGQYADSQEQFDFIARQLGRFNGTYLMEKEIPNQEWICRGWLKSWTTASRMYAPSPENYLHRLHRDNVRSIWSWFQGFNKQVENNLSSLERLPRVLAHQDLSQMNMLIVKNDFETDRLVLIDWQFMSISGVGEDLAKMFGVNMSLGIIPPERYGAFQNSLFNAYIAGLKDMGWQGDEGTGEIWLLFRHCFTKHMGSTQVHFIGRSIRRRSPKHKSSRQRCSA